MCRAVTCKVCGKTTWAGCGQHIASVKKNVPAGQWCSGQHSQGELQAAAQKNSPGLLARLFKR